MDENGNRDNGISSNGAVSHPEVDGIALVGTGEATPGNHRVAGVIDHLSASISANTPRLYDPSLGIGGIAAAVGDGRIIDPAVRAELAAWLAGFVDHVRAVRRGGLVGADAGRRS